MSNKPADTQIRALVAQWDDVRARGGAQAYQVAQCAKATAALYTDYDSFREFHIHLLDIRFPSTIRMHWDMAKAARLVQEETIWRALGWDGVRDLARVIDQTARKRISKRVLQLASGGSKSKQRKNAKLKPVTRSVFQGILKQIAPDMAEAPGARTPPNNGLRIQLAEEQAKTARLSSELAEATAKHASPDLAATLRRLIYQDGCQFIVNLLTEEERSAVGVSKLRERAS